MIRPGTVFTIAAENPMVPGCTVSMRVTDTVYHFSLAAKTDISAEVYPYLKLIVMAAGEMEVDTGDGQRWPLRAGQCLITPTDTPVGMRSKSGAVYTEICLRRDTEMNEIIKAGEAFKLAELLPYQEGRIVNMDIINEPKLKFVLMSFDKGTGLSEHAAPGEALIFALDGAGVIGYEGKDHPIKAGENFKFAKGGLHAVKATEKFKMVLLLMLE